MRIRCPYCSCHYDIHPDTLGNPLGNKKLGFGWWLQCYQCQKKFWLKSTTVINTGFSPVKAERNITLKKLYKFGHNKRKYSKKSSVLYILILVLLLIAGGGYYYKDNIQSFFVTKIKRFTAYASVGLQLSDIIYRVDRLDGKYRIAVMGNILNNTQNLLSCNGLHIVVLDNGKKVTDWKFVPDPNSVIPGDKVVFNTENYIPNVPSEIKVLVRIIN